MKTSHHAHRAKTHTLTLSPLLFAVALGLLAVLEVAWFVWFAREPLPNSNNGPVQGNQRLTRGDLLWRALPWVVPGLPPSEALLVQAGKELSHLEFLPQRTPIVLGGLLILGAALGLGRMLSRALGLRSFLNRPERLVLSFGLGLPALSALTLLMGRAGLLTSDGARLLLGTLLIVSLILVRPGRANAGAEADPDAAPSPLPRPGSAGWWLFTGLALPFVVTMTLASMLPTIDYDSLEYHLQGPKEYYQQGRVQFLPHNVYTSMPFSVEMLHYLGMLVLDDWWRGALVGQWLVALHAPMAALCIALVAGRWSSPRAAWIAALVYLTTPWIYRMAAIPYVEGPLCFYHAALIWAAARSWDLDPERKRPGRVVRFWLVVGLLAGGAMGCKYPALISAVVPLGVWSLIEAVRRRSPAVSAAYVVGCCVIMAPWLGKNLIDTGNPVYPLAYSVFGGSHWDADLDAKWSAGHGRKPVEFGLLLNSMIDVAGRSDWQSGLYVGLAPLALARRGARGRSLWVLIYLLYLFGTWWLLTHRLDRFWLPLLPAAAILAGLGSDWCRSRGWSILLAGMLAAHVFSNAVYDSTALVSLNEWTGDLARLRRSVPEMVNPPLTAMDNLLPDDVKVLLVGQASVFALNQPIVYNVVFNHETIEQWVRAAGDSPEALRESLLDRGIGYIYVDWFEVERFRQPGNYGFTPFVTPELFQGLVDQGVLQAAIRIDAKRELFRVNSAGTSTSPSPAASPRQANQEERRP